MAGLVLDECGDQRGTRSALLSALRIPRKGVLYDLEVTRRPGMPLWEGHAPFQVLTYRTPHGMRVQKDHKAFLPGFNSANVGVISDFVLGTTHCGTHIDALAHITVGPDSHWHGGFTESEHLGDWGPVREDASALPPLIMRGIVVDVASLAGGDRLPRGYGISADELAAAAAEQGVSPRPGDAVLIRTGQMSVWPDKTLLEKTAGSGVTLDAARWLAETCGASLVGTDTEALEQTPPESASGPDPVHVYLLVDRGVFIMENLYLEELAREEMKEFLLVVLPLKIAGATGSMVRPTAIV